MKPKHRRNLIAAYELLRSIPEKRFVPGLLHIVKDVKEFSYVPTIEEFKECGSLACAAGWLMLDKRFATPLAKYHFDGAVTENDSIYDETEGWDGWANRLFGEDEDDQYLTFERLFSSVGTWGSAYDGEIKSDKLTDKMLVLYRFRRALGDKPDEALAQAEKDYQR